MWELLAQIKDKLEFKTFFKPWMCKRFLCQTTYCLVYINFFVQYWMNFERRELILTWRFVLIFVRRPVRFYCFASGLDFLLTCKQNRQELWISRKGMRKIITNQFPVSLKCTNSSCFSTCTVHVRDNYFYSCIINFWSPYYSLNL